MYIEKKSQSYQSIIYLFKLDRLSNQANILNYRFLWNKLDLTHPFCYGELCKVRPLGHVTAEFYLDLFEKQNRFAIWYESLYFKLPFSFAYAKIA